MYLIFIMDDSEGGRRILTKDAKEGIPKREDEMLNRNHVRKCAMIGILVLNIN